MHSTSSHALHRVLTIGVLLVTSCGPRAERAPGADSTGAAAASSGAAASQPASTSDSTSTSPAAPAQKAASQRPQVDAKNVEASLAYDAATKTATIPMVAALTSNAGGWNFDGYAQGQMTIVVPVGTNVVMRFYNDDIVPHSLVVVAGDPAHVPSAPGDPAFDGASSPNPTAGQMTGGQAEVRFTADKAGRYLIVCGVPGHAVSGMWDLLQVSASAKTPSIRTR